MLLTAHEGWLSPFSNKTCTASEEYLAGGVASFFLRTKRHLASLNTLPSLAKMLVLGDKDQFSSVRSLQGFLTSHPQTIGPSTAHMPCAAKLVVMRDCDHFFVHHRTELAKLILQFCVERHQQLMNPES